MVHWVWQGTETEFRLRVVSAMALQHLCIFAAVLTTPNEQLLLHNPYALAAALALGLYGVLWRAWATGYLPVYIIRDVDVSTKKLVTSGPFSLTRNPLYFGTYFVMASTVLLFTWWAFAAFLVLMPLRTVRIITTEEVQLRATFGQQFDQYCADVPRLIPSVSGWLRMPALLLQRVDWWYGLKGNAWFALTCAGYATAFVAHSWLLVMCIAWAVSVPPLWYMYRGAAKSDTKEAAEPPPAAYFPSTPPAAHSTLASRNGITRAG